MTKLSEELKNLLDIDISESETDHTPGLFVIRIEVSIGNHSAIVFRNPPIEQKDIPSIMEELRDQFKD